MLTDHAAAPTSGAEQSCALCRRLQPKWLHTLNPSMLAYRAWGKGYTLPSFWCLCVACETTYESGDDEVLVEVMARAARNEGQPDSGQVNGLDVTEEDFRKPLRAFRSADASRSKLR